MISLAALAANPVLLRLAGAALVAAATFLAGWYVGHDNATDAARVAALQAQADAATRYRAAVADGERRVAAVLGQMRGLNDHATQLQERLDTHARNHVPLVVARPVRCPGPVPGAGLVAGAGAGAGPAPAAAPLAAAQADTAVPQQPGPAPDIGLRLTLGAVSLWNSALAGRDMPAGACSPDAAASFACAAESTIDITDAWRNHVTNAASCAADRARYQALIDHVKARGQ